MLEKFQDPSSIVARLSRVFSSHCKKRPSRAVLPEVDRNQQPRVHVPHTIRTNPFLDAPESIHTRLQPVIWLPPRPANHPNASCPLLSQRSSTAILASRTSTSGYMISRNGSPVPPSCTFAEKKPFIRTRLVSASQCFYGIDMITCHQKGIVNRQSW